MDNIHTKAPKRQHFRIGVTLLNLGFNICFYLNFIHPNICVYVRASVKIIYVGPHGNSCSISHKTIKIYYLEFVADSTSRCGTLST